MYGSGASTRIALAILGVQSAGFAPFYGNCKKTDLIKINKNGYFNIFKLCYNTTYIPHIG